MVDVCGGRAADLAGVVVALEDDLAGLPPSRICVDLATGFVAASCALSVFARRTAATSGGDESAAAADAKQCHRAAVRALPPGRCDLLAESLRKARRCERRASDIDPLVQGSAFSRRSVDRPRCQLRPRPPCVVSDRGDQLDGLFEVVLVPEFDGAGQIGGCRRCDTGWMAVPGAEESAVGADQFARVEADVRRRAARAPLREDGRNRDADVVSSDPAVDAAAGLNALMRRAQSSSETTRLAAGSRVSRSGRSPRRRSTCSRGVQLGGRSGSRHGGCFGRRPTSGAPSVARGRPCRVSSRRRTNGRRAASSTRHHSSWSARNAGESGSGHARIRRAMSRLRSSSTSRDSDAAITSRRTWAGYLEPRGDVPRPEPEQTSTGRDPQRGEVATLDRPADRRRIHLRDLGDVGDCEHSSRRRIHRNK